MEKITAIFMCLFAFYQVCTAQTFSEPMEKQQFNRLINDAFNKLVTSNPSTGEIVNYAAIDPVNASFSLKSTVPINKTQTCTAAATIIEYTYKDQVLTFDNGALQKIVSTQ